MSEYNPDGFLRMVREAKILSYDTETSGVDWRRNFPIGYVACDGPGNAMYIPVRHGGGANLEETQLPDTPTGKWRITEFERALANSFELRSRSPDKLTVGHNMIFDVNMSANAGIMLGRNLCCTQNTQALIDEYTKKFSLDGCATYHNVTAKKGEVMYAHLSNLFGVPPDKASMSEFWRTRGNDPIVTEYTTGDGITTLEVYYKQMEEIEAQDLQVVWRLESELIWTVYRLSRRGIKVNLDSVAKLKQFIDDKLAAAKLILPPDFNPRSPNQMKAYLESHGLTDWPLTAAGNPSFTGKWLKKSVPGKAVVDLRQWSNLLSTFVTPLVDEHMVYYEDGTARVHSELNQLKSDDFGTISGRFSSTRPNLQAVPKHNKEKAKPFREVFEADDGYDLYEADLSQAEPRLFAHYSKDENLLAGYNAEPFVDVHTLVATKMNVDRGTTGKRMNMGIFTGMQIDTFAEHMGLPRAEAAELWLGWYKLFPGVKNFQDLAISTMRSRGYVKTLLGRRGRLDLPRFAYKAVSKIIQGGNADIIKWAMLVIDKELEAQGDTTQLLLTIHDSLLWQAPIGPEGEEVSRWIMAQMCNVQGEPFNLRVPFVADCRRGKTWSDATFGKEFK